MGPYNHLPPIHRPDGERPRHDDYKIKLFGQNIPFWPFNLIPRTWTSLEIRRPPKMILGNQQFFSNFETGAVDKNAGILINSAVWGPKPIPRRGEWQFSLVFTVCAGHEIPLPYFAFTLKSGLHFRLGARWTDRAADCPYTYVTFPSIAIKKI